jgi:hypothetical protein
VYKRQMQQASTFQIQEHGQTLRTVIKSGVLF